jgi:hypothetical protein
MSNKNAYQVFNSQCARLLGVKHFAGPRLDPYYDDIIQDLQHMINANEPLDDINNSVERATRHWLSYADLL